MDEQIVKAGKFIRQWMAENPGIKDLAPMYEAYPANNRKYISQILIGIEPWKHMSYIPALAFTDCKNITSIVLPNGVTSIGDYAFQNCNDLTSITIPDSVTYIGLAAFSKCTKLTSAAMSDKINKINDRTFEWCRGLTSIKIPDNVTSIGDSAFWGCKGFTNLTIPDSVTSIGWSAFEGCSMISSISIGKGVARVNYSSISSCYRVSTISIHNPKTDFSNNTISTTNLTDIYYMGTCDECRRYFNLNALKEDGGTIEINCSDGTLRTKYFPELEEYRFTY